MAGSYYAITRRQSQWVYVCSGSDPALVYHHALDILRGQHDTYSEDAPILSPTQEHAIDNLRVVPESVARQTYQVRFGAAVAEE